MAPSSGCSRSPHQSRCLAKAMNRRASMRQPMPREEQMSWADANHDRVAAEPIVEAPPSRQRKMFAHGVMSPVPRFLNSYDAAQPIVGRAIAKRSRAHSGAVS